MALCALQRADRPQILRLAAQLVSRGQLDVGSLRLVARRERVERVLAELARQALKVEPSHPTWHSLLEAFGALPHLRSPLLHWTRLANPLFQPGKCDPIGWRLVA